MRFTRVLGLSLVELMIALVLGALVISASLSVVVGSSQSRLVNAQYQQIQDSGRVAMKILADELRYAGYLAELTSVSLNSGMMSVSGVVGNDCVGPGTNDQTLPQPQGAFVTVWADTKSDNDRLSCVDGALNGSDLLQIKRVIGPDTPASALDDNRYYLLSNMADAHLFPGNLSPTPSLASGRYWHYQHRVFYVENRDDGIPALKWRQLYVNGGMVEEELVEGVERLKLRVGGDLNGDGVVDTWLEPSAVPLTLWQSSGVILAVQIQLLVRPTLEVNHASSTPVVFEMFGGDVNFDDGIPRRLYQTTIVLANARLTEGSL